MRSRYGQLSDSQHAAEMSAESPRLEARAVAIVARQAYPVRTTVNAGLATTGSLMTQDEARLVREWLDDDPKRRGR